MLYFIFAALVVVLDRLFKMWVASAIEPGQVIRLIPGVIQLTYAENTGAAFSLMSNMRWALVAVSVVAVLALAVVVLLYRRGALGRLAAASILGGAVGNLIDRIMTGRVIDMFEPTFVRFAIFNVADVFITLGGIVFIIHTLVTSRRESAVVRREVAAEAAEVYEPYAPYEPSETLTEEQILEEYYLEQQRERDENDRHGS
ncbi:MAG: signal peptidase II [Oscillospiraceae bacterium]|jgi:signal peptidase II|nr:signal peptidase II [Oscillospiraceae bacterium]